MQVYRLPSSSLKLFWGENSSQAYTLLNVLIDHGDTHKPIPNAVAPHSEMLPFFWKSILQLFDIDIRLWVEKLQHAGY